MKTKTITILIFWTFTLFFTVVPGGGGAIAADSGHSNQLEIATPATPPRSPDLLTLARAKQIAVGNSPTLASALERVNQAREAVSQAKADRLPTLSATAGYNYTEATDNSAPGYDEIQYSSQLSATQVLFDGFYRKYAQLSAQYGEQISLTARDKARNLLAWSVAQTYLNVQLARENIKITQSDMAFNQDQETEAVAKEKSGTGSYSDVLNFKSKVNSAKSSMLSARQDLRESLNGLAALLGYEDARLPEGMAIAPLDMESAILDLSENPLDSLDANMEGLLTQRPDLEGADLAVRQSDMGIRIARAGYYPTISLTGGYGTSAGDSFADTDSLGAYLGINVSFDIYTGGATRSRVREALSAKRESEKDLAEARISAVSDIRSSAQDISTAREQLTLQQENTNLIQITRDLVEKEYRVGQASLVRLNEAQNDLMGAMGDLAIAKASLILALERFDYYTGVNIQSD